MKLKFKLLFPEGDAAPAAAPAPVTPQELSAPVETETPSADSGIDWADLSADVDDDAGSDFGDEPGAPAEPAAPAPEAQPPAVVEAPAAETPPEVIQPEQVAPVTPPVTQTPEQARQAENAYMAQLENLYKFDEETTLTLQTEPEKVLPALAAKLHLDVMKSVLAQVQGMIPEVMQQQTTMSTRETKAKGEFYGSWPELQKYEAQVLEVGKMYRAMNPTASAEEAIQRIGETAMTALGLTRAAPPAPPPTPPRAGFRPAVPGRVSAPEVAPTEWDQLLDDDD